MSLLPEQKPTNQNPQQAPDSRPAWLRAQEGALIKGSLRVVREQSTQTLPSDAQKIFYERADEILAGQDSNISIEPTIPEDVRQELVRDAQNLNKRAEQTTKTQKRRLFPENPKKKIRKLIKFLKTH